MKERILLRGITWDHSRGYTPLVAASQRYGELYPHLAITWKKRTLKEFEDAPLDKLAPEYDLLIIDHPWVGCAANRGLVLPLDRFLPEAVLTGQAINSVGASHISYQYDGHQWALAIDAATPVASYRGDLFARDGVELPETWEHVVALAKAGKIAMPSVPIYLLMYFYTFCLALGEEPFQTEEEVVGADIGVQVLEWMRSFWHFIDKRFFTMNPIQVAECMAKEDRYWYAPFLYGYSNYARVGYADNVLTYNDVVAVGTPREKMRTTLGGAGLAVSAACRHKKEAMDFVAWVTSETMQSTLYVENGGQPGHRSAWENPRVNLNCNNFFKNTLPALDRAYMRPRYNGYLIFQDRAGLPLYHFLLEGGSPKQVLKEMNMIYQESINLPAR